jgi:hypothetical protein
MRVSSTFEARYGGTASFWRRPNFGRAVRLPATAARNRLIRRDRELARDVLVAAA